MKTKKNPKRPMIEKITARIHIHVHRGCVDDIKCYGLSEPVELHVHDYDVLTAGDIPGSEISIYRLGLKKKRKKK